MNPLIGITGASGLIGSHVRSHFLASGVRNLKIANRETFEDFEQLCEFVRGCQTIIHLAGMNRGDKAEIAVTNPRLARDLVRALESEGSGANIVYSNSTHQNLETPYGISKRTVAEILGEWSSRSG
ncbi:MAG: NAD-dependent epimerase/dehydratase family protein, partial [Verrucomicrobiota bacterium]